MSNFLHMKMEIFYKKNIKLKGIRHLHLLDYIKILKTQLINLKLFFLLFLWVFIPFAPLMIRTCNLREQLPLVTNLKSKPSNSFFLFFILYTFWFTWHIPWLHAAEMRERCLDTRQAKKVYKIKKKNCE